MSTRFSVPDLDDVYNRHPQSANQLIRRVTEDGVSFSNIREHHLANHSLPFATDQNHPGGTPFVERLALLAEIDATSLIADLGTGIGGAARWLAYSSGCQIVAIEANRSRCEQARYLNSVTRLDHLVNVKCADFTSFRLAGKFVDVVWGQASWVHCTDLEQMFRNWSAQLRADGCFAFEDSYLKREPRDEERSMIDELLQLWAASIPNKSEWLDHIQSIGFKADHIEDLTDTYRNEFVLQINAAQSKSAGLLPHSEVRGWEIAHELVGRGLLGYLRIVARRQ